MAFRIPNEAAAPFLDQAKIDAVDTDAIAGAFQLYGVVSGLAVTERGAGANMSVDVAAGSIVAAGVDVTATNPGNFTIDASDPTHARFDLIVVSNAGLISVVKGTNSASEPSAGNTDAVFPSYPSTSVLLAAVYVAAGATSITTASHIQDRRFFLTNTQPRRTIHDEVAAALTNRPAMHFMGAGIKVQDNAGSTRTEVIVGAYYDAIVDSGDTNAVGKGNVYSTLQAAITAGHKHILIRAAGDSSDISITTENVVRIIGAGAGTPVPVNLTCGKADVEFDNLGFAATWLKITGARDAIIGCVFSGALTPATVTINNGAGITSTATTIDYDGEVGSFPEQGIGVISAAGTDSEWITWNAKSATQLTTVERGMHDTLKVAHADNIVITNYASGHLIIDANNVQVVENMFNATSGAGAALWLMRNSSYAMIENNRFISVSDRHSVMYHQASGTAAKFWTLAMNYFDHDGDDYAIGMLQDSQGTDRVMINGANIIGNTIQGFTTGKQGGILLRMAKAIVANNNIDSNGLHSSTTTVSSDPGAGGTTIAVASTANFPFKGQVRIDSETIAYSAKDGTNLYGCIRGFAETTAAAHTAGATVTIWSQKAINMRVGVASPNLFIGNQFLNCYVAYEEAGPALTQYSAGFISANAFSGTKEVGLGVDNILANNYIIGTRIDFKSKTGITFSGNLGLSCTVANEPSDLVVLGNQGTFTGLSYLTSLPHDTRIAGIKFDAATSEISNPTSATPVKFRQSVQDDPVVRFTTTTTGDDPQEDVIQGRVTTTTASAATVTFYNAPASKTVQVVAYVVARRTGGSAGTAEDGASYILHATVKNVAGTATIIGAVTTISSHEDQAAWNATIDTSGGVIRVRVTGDTNNDVTWHCTMHIFEVGS